MERANTSLSTMLNNGWQSAGFNNSIKGFEVYFKVTNELDGKKEGVYIIFNDNGTEVGPMKITGATLNMLTIASKSSDLTFART